VRTLYRSLLLRSASSDGRTAGLGVWSHKGPTLKGIKYCNHPDTELCFPGPRLDIFWTVLVCMKSSTIQGIFLLFTEGLLLYSKDSTTYLHPQLDKIHITHFPLVDSTDTRGGMCRSTFLWGTPLPTARAVPPFLPGWWSIRYKNLQISVVAVSWPHSTASKCHSH
jgi:hypothetical protein